MTDFKKAFEDGIENAKIAKIAKDEVKAIFEDLNKQLDDATSGKVKIKITRSTRVIKESFPNTFSSIIQGLGATRSENYSAISAINPTIESCPAKELAIWEQDKKGYPCTVSFNNEDIICDDKKSLERALENLLRDPSIADILSSLIKLEPKPKGA
jgi:hypothetical protein